MFVWKLACIFPFIFTWLEQWQRVLCFSLTNVPSSIIIYLRHHPVLSRHSQRSWFADSGESKPLEVVWLRAETVCVWERVLWVGESWRRCEGEWEVLWSRGRADGGEGGGLGWGRGGRGDSSVHLHFIQTLLTLSQWGCQSTGGRGDSPWRGVWSEPSYARYFSHSPSLTATWGPAPPAVVPAWSLLRRGRTCSSRRQWSGRVVWRWRDLPDWPHWYRVKALSQLRRKYSLTDLDSLLRCVMRAAKFW